MISTLAWVPRGAPRTQPVRFELSNEELQRIEGIAKGEAEIEKKQKKSKDAEEDSDDSGSDLDQPLSAPVDDSGLPPELRMDDYDDESDNGDFVDNYDEDDEDDQMELFDQGESALALDAEFDSEDEDKDDDIIKTTDNMIILAVTEEEEESHLEVQILTDEGTLYTHHDIILPDFPLSLAWMDIAPHNTGDQKTFGNYIAVGTFSPAIEIWNLDVLDPLEPSAVLGGEKPKSSKKSKKNAAPEYLPGSHTSSVLSLSWNSLYRPALASGSADHTVKVWDVTTQTCNLTLDHHSDKVQSVLWHTQEAWLLASGGYDKKIFFTDCRNDKQKMNVSVTSDIESLVWDPFQPFHIYASLEDGKIVGVDIRKVSSNNSNESPFIFNWQGHEKTVSNIHFSPGVRGMLASCSVDKTVKVWDVTRESQPQCVAYKSMNVGKLFTLKYSYDDPFLLATAGDKGSVAVWESDEMEIIKNHFNSRIENSTFKNPYLSLRQSEEIAANPSLGISLENSAYNNISTSDFKIEPEDESWMDDNTGIETNKSNSKNKKNKKK